jgi:hypothetical protein
MLRRALTAVSISAEDVRKHLDHVVLQQLPQYETFHSMQMSGLALPVSEMYDHKIPPPEAFEDIDKPHHAMPSNFVVTTDPKLGDCVSPAHSRQSMLDSNSDEYNQLLYNDAKGGTYEQLHLHPASERIRSVSRNGFLDVVKSTQALSNQQNHKGKLKIPQHCLDYGGFVEPPIENHSVGNSNFMSQVDSLQSKWIVDKRSCLLYTAGPDNISLPHVEAPLPIRRIRTRLPLPGPTLILSPETSDLDRQTIVSLTPRLASYECPGLLSQPARRPRSYRKRTISYSFEESERASTTYEDPQPSESDSNYCFALSNERRSLHDDLRGSSLQSSSTADNITSSTPEPIASPEVGSLSYSSASDLADDIVVYPPCPELPLPLPFFTVPRSISLTSAQSIGQSQLPIRSISSPIRSMEAFELFESKQTPIVAFPRVCREDRASPPVGRLEFLNLQF